MGSYPLAKNGQLLALRSGTQAKMDAHDMGLLGNAWDLNHSMKHAPAGALAFRNIDILPKDNWIFTQDGITVMPCMVDGVLAVGLVRP